MKAFAGQSHDDNLSTENLSIPFDWIFGTTLTVSALFFSVIWWVRGIKAQVDNNSRSVEIILSRCANEQTKMDNWYDKLQKELRKEFATNIAQSSSDICHGFELFAVEMRANLKRLDEKIDERNASLVAINTKQEKLDRQFDALSSELVSIVNQLQGQHIDIHFRELRQD